MAWFGVCVGAEDEANAVIVFKANWNNKSNLAQIMHWDGFVHA